MSASTAELNIKQQLAALSPAKRALLELKLLKKKARTYVADEPIPPRPDRDSAPLSYTQEGLWVLSQLMPGASLYHVPKAVRLTGKLNVTALKETLDLIVARHESLRTSFTTVDGIPMQVIARAMSVEMPLIDLTQLSETDREAEAQSVIDQEARRPFDLSQGPLIRAILLRLAEQEHILLVTTHHIVTDGWSMGIFHRELMELYEAFSAGRPAGLPDLPIQYADYACWHRQWFAGAVYESQLSYWKKQFATLPPVLELPGDHPRGAVQAFRAFRGAQQTLRLSKILTRQLKELCQKEEATPFMVLLAAYYVLLHRYTGEEDIVVGSPIAGRCMAETEQLIGLFINVLALRVSLCCNPTFREMLQRVKDVAFGAYAHQDLPFETLVKEVRPDRTLSHNPLFQVMFVLQNEPIPPLEFGGLTVGYVQVGNVTTNFDLTLDIIERENQFLLKFECNADLFEEETIARMMGHFQTLLEGLVANPEQRISELALLTAGERHQLLIEWTDTRTDYSADKCIQELFEHQVASTPDAIALIAGDRELTYAELNSRANQLACYLRKSGIGPDTRVGVCLERSPEMIVALLGILKAGGAYVPLDPAYPRARLQFMIEDANAPVLLTEKKLLHTLPETTSRIICIDELGQQIAQESTENPDLATSAENLAYVIYTSGSTGTPKGVAVAHRNVVRLVRSTNYANFSAAEVFLQFAPVSFDASTFEIWGSLLNGARLAMMPPGKASLKELAEALKRYRVTTLWLTAGLFHLMVDHHLEELRGLRQLLAGGDVLSVPHVRRVLQELPGCRVINGYGPTENTPFTCCYPITNPASLNGSVPISRPISNTYVYALDPHLNPVPVGVPGELYIGGDGLARDYLNRPELTAEKFVRDPFSGNGARLYRSGDLVRYRPSGDIEFLGRIDNQVKVRGYRVELGEIEAVMAQHPEISEGVVVVRQDAGDKHLAAYLTPRNGHQPAVEDVRSFLRERLPDYMVPSTFVVLESLPLSPTGKVDRLALPSTNGFKSTKGFAAPEDELELKLIKIWEKVLNVRPVGINDNFFDLGGHSLLAVRLFALIEKSFGRNLPLATLFQAPTVKELARVLRKEGLPAPWSSLVMIQPGGERTPLFCVHAAGGNVIEYRDLARLLGPDQPFYGLQANGLDGKSDPHTTIPEMAAHYIKEMREVQPNGPYLLGGRSSGGTIAFEMACQLKAAGEEVALLALLDAYPAGYFKLLPGAASFRQRMQRRARRWNSHLMNLSQLKFADRISYLLNKLKYAPAKIKHKVYRRAYKLYRRIGRQLPEVLRNIEELNFAAVKDYVPQVYAGRATLFSANDLTAAYDVEDGWRELVADLEVIEIPGNHLDIIKEPHVSVLAEKLNACIRSAS